MIPGDVKDMEARLLQMIEDFGPVPTDEQRADYRALWLRWCDAKGLPPTGLRDPRRLAKVEGIA